MIFSVRAKLIDKQAKKFFHNLTNGTIAQQKPEGKEIVAAMQRARITSNGYVFWTETCYCPTPLKHERETQLNQYFSDIKTTPTEDHKVFDGIPLNSKPIVTG